MHKKIFVINYLTGKEESQLKRTLSKSGILNDPHEIFFIGHDPTKRRIIELIGETGCLAIVYASMQVEKIMDNKNSVAEQYPNVHHIAYKPQGNFSDQHKEVLPWSHVITGIIKYIQDIPDLKPVVETPQKEEAALIPISTGTEKIAATA